MGSLYGMLSPLAYFYSLLRPSGEFSLQVSFIDEEYCTWHLFIGKKDFSLVRHWHDTLIIGNQFGIAMQILYSITQLQEQDMTILLAGFVAALMILYECIKDYLDTYVQISKI